MWRTRATSRPVGPPSSSRSSAAPSRAATSTSSLPGSAAALAVASDTPRSSIANKHGIDPSKLSGDATLSLDASIPIYESDFSDVIPTFRMALSKFTSTSPIDGRLIEDANLVLEGSPKSFTVKGLGKLDGYDASIDLILGTAAPDTSAVTVELDDAARQRLGFAFGSLLTGPILAVVTHSTSRASRSRST